MSASTDNYEYMTLTGTGADPSILGSSFYASIDRVTVSGGA
jgi:hypothetical protein